jgi:hypothetical protein
MTPLNRAANCPICRDTFRLERTGRKRATCSDRCRKEASRRQILSRNGEQASLPTSAESVTKRPELGSEISGLQTQKPDLGKASLFWIKVNEVTCKLTDGVMERTPACHGTWPGVNIERGLGWAMNAGWVAGRSIWYARVGNKSYGPTSLAGAKAAAQALLLGAPVENDELFFLGPVDLNVVAAAALDGPGPEEDASRASSATGNSGDLFACQKRFVT